MCLSTIYRGRKKKQSIVDLEIREDGYVWLWKVFDYDSKSNLIAQFRKYDFYEGKNTARGFIIRDLEDAPEYTQYPIGFHCFSKRKNAAEWALTSNTSMSKGVNRIIVPVQIRKKWISCIGKQSGMTVVVCKHIII